MKILVTGALGYIGSHAIVSFLENNMEVIGIDNLVNSNTLVYKNIEKITNKKFTFKKMDVLNKNELENLFCEYRFDCVVHFAALKSVNESIKEPIKYYENNIIGTINLLALMEKYDVDKFIFSSSATVYDSYNNESPLNEFTSLMPINPYGRTKLMIETIISDYCKSKSKCKSIILRYFNPIGAHKSGLLGERPKGIPNNLMPYIIRVAKGIYPSLNVFGGDYNTRDGSGIRDFIHVQDLADAHCKALKKLDEIENVEIYNIGTGKGTSVIELIDSFEKVNKIKIPYKIVQRREGDVPVCYADCEKANKCLNWCAERSLEDMCRDSWNFAKLDGEIK